MARKGTPKTDQHDWIPDSDGTVKCSKCLSIVTLQKARQGIGPCTGKPVTNEQPPALNLCDTCHMDLATCESEPEYAGPEDYSVIACAAYRPESDEPPEAYQKSPEAEPRPGPNYIDPPEHCNACGQRLAIVPVNSRMDKVSCVNQRCTLWRERLRWIPKPGNKPRRRRKTSAED